MDRRTRATQAPRVQREVMQNYERVMKALARSERGDDRQLAADLVRHFTGRSQVREKEKRRSQEREYPNRHQSQGSGLGISHTGIAGRLDRSGATSRTQAQGLVHDFKVE